MEALRWLRRSTDETAPSAVSRLLDRGAFITEALTADRREHRGSARFATSHCARALRDRDEADVRAAGVVAQYRVCLEPDFSEPTTVKLLESLARRRLVWTVEEVSVLLDLTRGRETGWGGVALRLPLAAAESLPADERGVLRPGLQELADAIADSSLSQAKKGRALARLEVLLLPPPPKPPLMSWERPPQRAPQPADPTEPDRSEDNADPEPAWGAAVWLPGWAMPETALGQVRSSVRTTTSA